MPKGKPDFASVRFYPAIVQLTERFGTNALMKAIFLLVKDFCDTMGFAKTLDETQQIECASMLLDKCDNFRLEDYVMMFALAKRGELYEGGSPLKIYNSVNFDVISRIYNAYWERRSDEGERLYEEEQKAKENEWRSKHIEAPRTEEEQQQADRFREASRMLQEKFGPELEEERRKKDEEFVQRRDAQVAAFKLQYAHLMPDENTEQ